MQDPDQLVQSNSIKKTANVVTDMDAMVNYLIKGGKRKTPTKRKTATKRKTNRKKL
jgi:ribosomal protein L17